MTIVVDVFADVRCPFAHVGLRRLVDRRDELGLDVTVHARAWPLELVNDAPLDPQHIAAEVEALRSQVAPDLFAGFSPPRFAATSIPALALTSAAYDRDPGAGERMALAVRRAQFEEGRDIAAAEVLTELAEGEGVIPPADAHDRVVQEWDEGLRRGVVGSPHFFVGDDGWFCPVLDIRHEDGQLRVAENRPAFDAFLARLRR